MIIMKEIDRLVDLALQCKHKSSEDHSADDYAFVAANIIVMMKAHTIRPEVVPYAEMLAVSSFFELYKQFAALIFHEIDKEITRKKHVSKGTPEPISLPYNTLKEAIDGASFGEEAQKLFLQRFSTDMNAAARAKACYIHAFSAARVAYVGARITAYCASDSDSDELFKVEMKKRLLANLYVPVESGFFMRVMCHRTTKIVGLLLLLAGLTALSFGIAGVAVASFGAMIASFLTLNATSLSLIGGGVSTASGGLLAGHFFAKKQIKEDNEERADFVDNINRVSM